MFTPLQLKIKYLRYDILRTIFKSKTIKKFPLKSAARKKHASGSFRFGKTFGARFKLLN